MTYTVTTRELLAQATAIAQSTVKPRISMPSSLRSVVERAIQARRRCTEWFQRSDIRNEYSNQQHKHFVNVLTDSLKILEPCVDDRIFPEKSKEFTTGNSTNLAGITNRFDTLAFDDATIIDDVEVSKNMASVGTARKTPASKGKPVIESFELDDEEKDNDDLAFRIFCMPTT